MLPITKIYPQLIAELKRHSMVLLKAPPGAGKSTWLPLQLIRDKHFSHIVMLEPRRLAARSIANYLADCQKEKLGQSIGLRIRQDKQVSTATKLEVVSEGMLTRMLQNDPELKGVDCLIFDEFHERSLAADTALAFAREAQQALREDLKILLMSATLDTGRIQEKFSCPVVSSEGRSYPIEETYQTVKDEKRWLNAMPALVRRAMTEQSGNCLVFLPGQKEIEWLAGQLRGIDSTVSIHTLYGSQTKAQQQAAIAPPNAGERKIVLSTNVAETSLTIDGIRVVVDSGRKRFARFNLNTGATELCTVKTSMASSIQRAGRAGRTEPGAVYRLGSKEAFRQRESHDIPEILSSDISSLVLEAKFWGAELEELAFIDAPTSAQKNQALGLLRMLEAIDHHHRLTKAGEQILNFGTDIRWAHMLIKAKELDKAHPGIAYLGVYLLALLDSKINKQPELAAAILAQYRTPHPVFTSQLNYWLARTNISGKGEPQTQYLHILLALAYPDRIAKRRGKGYLLENGAGVDCRDDCWLSDEYIAIAELGGPNGTHIFSGTALNVAELEPVLPHLFSMNTICEFDEKSGRFVHEKRSMLGAIVIKATPCDDKIDTTLRSESWLSYIKKNGLSVFSELNRKSNKDKKNNSLQLLFRMILAYKLFPNKYPEVSLDALLRNIECWLAPHLVNIKNLDELKALPLAEPLRNIFDWQCQADLNRLFPTHIHVPSGSNIRISYQLEGPAVMSVRMQEVFGMTASPVLANGKLALLMDLLSPAQRSLQLTQDLAGFWASAYEEVKKEMKGRYPKHFWPDDPSTAQATSKVKSKMGSG